MDVIWLVAVKGNEIHLVSNTVDRFVGTIE